MGYSIQRARPPASAAVQAGQIPALRPVQVELFPGFAVELDLTDEMPRQVLRNVAGYEAPCPQLLRQFCTSPGDVFFDVGANFGYFSYYLLAHAPHAVVHSFEPNADHVRRQRAVAARYAPDRYFPHQLGLSDQPGEVTLTMSTIDSGWSTFGTNPHFTGQEQTLRTQVTPVVSFDGWCASQGLVLPATPSWVMKMDIEGYEVRALRGMEKALRGRAFKAVLVEVLDHTLNFCGSSAGELFSTMQRAGYVPFDVWLQPTVQQPQEARNVLFLPANAPSGA